MAYAPGPPSSRRRPVPPPPPLLSQRNPSTTTIRQRPQVQIPPGARPPINPSSPTAVAESLQNVHLRPPAVPPRSSWSATNVPHAESNPGGNEFSPLQRPWTHVAQPARPWELSAFVAGSHVGVDDWDYDSGYGGSSQGHYTRDDEYTPTSASLRREKRDMRVTRSEHSHLTRGEDSWEKKRWGMDSESSFETASNGEQIGSGVLADHVLDAETTRDKLTLFQTAAISGFDDWAAVVPDEARHILDKHEIQRQSIIYELIKTERNYVIMLQIFLYVSIAARSSHSSDDSDPGAQIFRDGLVYANPPIIPNRDKLRTFVEEVFFNAQEILSIHLGLRDRLFERQRDQHPIYQSVADIYLEWLLERTEPYTRFQKHLPRALNRHKTELRLNAAYRNFFDDIEKILSDLKTAGMDDLRVPRLEDPNKPTLEFLAANIRKQDFNAFLDAFNNRFTRIQLQFTTMQKHTAEDHQDVRGDGAPIPLIISTIHQILSVASVELENLQKRVDFENFCKKLHFRKGEIIDLDWYDERRQLFIQGPLARRNRREVEWHGWTDLYVGVLDNYLVVTKELSNRGGGEQYNVVSRPIPMDYLRLAKPLNGPPETRRAEGCIIRDKLLGDSIPMWPFTLYHVADPVQRRYTFYASSDMRRTQWIEAFQEAKTIREVHQNENKYFGINPLSGRRFNTRTALVTANMAAKVDFTGQALAAAPFAYGGEYYLVVSTQTGIYMGLRHNPTGIQKVLKLTDVTHMASLQNFDKLLILANETLYAYSFQSLVRVWRREADIAEVTGSGERVSRHRDSAVQFFRAGVCDGRMLVAYMTKSLLQMNLCVLEALSEPISSPTVARGLRSKLSLSAKEAHSRSFKQFGETLSLPRDATDIIMLNKRIVIACQSQVVILDPKDPAMKAYPIPDFMVNPSAEYGNAEAIEGLKDRCSRSKSLGMVLSRSKELMVVFADFGCYVTKYGAPARQSAFVRWETRATSVAFRWPHALLFSSDYIEIRNVESGGLVQVVNGRDMRLLYSGPPYEGPVLAAMRGEDDATGKTDSVVELLETAPIEIEQGQVVDDALWREWDI
ncbi:hypothetical protein FRC06_001802 [Ceratobasidium sp. 370]|nr:hypothetical protein FRC06_001802 [Ceratobasidium sp. 370]